MTVSKELKKKNTPMKAVLFDIRDSRALKEKNRVKLDGMILTCLNIIESIQNLYCTNLQDYNFSIVLGMIKDGADLNERMCNKNGLGISSTTKDNFLDECAKKIKMKTVSNTINIYAADNVSKKKKSWISTSDFEQETYSLFCQYAQTESRFPKSYIERPFDRNEYYVDLKDFEYEIAFPQCDFDVMMDAYESSFFINKCELYYEKKFMGDVVEIYGRDLVDVKKKRCENCDIHYGLRKQTCDTCGLGLSNKKEMQEKVKVIRKKVVTGMEKVVRMVMKEIGTLQNTLKSKEGIHVEGEEEEEEEEEAEGEGEGEGDDDDESFNSGVYYGDYEEEIYPDDDAVMKSIGGESLNPSSNVGVEYIIEYFFKLAQNNEQNVTPLFMDGSPLAIAIRKIMKERKNIDDLKWRNLVVEIGLMHLRKKVMSSVFHTEDEICPQLLPAMGWNTEGKLKYIKNCKDMHQSQHTCESLSNSFNKEFIEKVCKMAEISDAMELDYDIFKTYMKRLRKEESTAASSFLHDFHLVERFLYSSIRKGNIKNIVIAKRLLSKLIGVSPSHIYDLILNFECVERTVIPDSVRALMDVYSILHNLTKDGYEGHEAKLENLNKWLELCVGNPTPENWMKVSKLLEELIRIRMNYLSSLGLLRDDNGDRNKISHWIEGFQARYIIRSTLLENGLIKIKYKKKRHDFTNIYNILETIHREKIKNLVNCMKNCEVPKESIRKIVFVNQALKNHLEWEEAQSEESALTEVHLKRNIFRGWKKLEFSGQHDIGQGEIYLPSKDMERCINGYAGCICGWGLKTCREAYECDKCSKGVGSKNRVFFQSPSCGKIMINVIGSGRKEKKEVLGICGSCLGENKCFFCPGQVYNQQRDDDTEGVDYCSNYDCDNERPFFHSKCAEKDGYSTQHDGETYFFCSQSCCDDAEF